MNNTTSISFIENYVLGLDIFIYKPCTHSTLTIQIENMNLVKSQYTVIIETRRC